MRTVAPACHQTTHARRLTWSSAHYSSHSSWTSEHSSHLLSPGILASGIGVFLCSSNYGNNKGLKHFDFSSDRIDLLYVHRTEMEERFVIAAKGGDLQLLKKLLGNGIDVNCRHSLGWNALHAAVVNGNWDAVQLLIENGADVNAKDEFSSARRIASQEGINSIVGKYSLF